jgi:hypothetical protein
MRLRVCCLVQLRREEIESIRGGWCQRTCRGLIDVVINLASLHRVSIVKGRTSHRNSC